MGIPNNFEGRTIIDKNGLPITPKERSQIITSVSELPVFQYKDALTRLLSAGKDIILDAKTGSGKSTLMPIFAREATGRKVIQTVPRVLSAMTLGEWISKYLISRTGDIEYTLGYKEIGYRTGGGSSSSHTSNLSIHTDGLEMMREMYSKIFPDVLILDEVQNLAIATEILLFIHKHKLDTQIIIMSATLNTEIYTKYMEASGRDFNVVTIPGKVFPIKEEMQCEGESIDKTIELAKSGKHVLHIVSGKSRIDSVIGELQKTLGIGYEVISLHAEMTKEDQFKVVIPPPSPIIRVIVATNVAEESITIPYLNAVVDEANHKVGSINEFGIPELRVEATTQANTTQRKGRVGRVQEGEYFRFSKISFEDLHEYPSAQIERTLLEREILLFEEANMGLYHLVSQAIDRGGDAFLHPINKKLLLIGQERLTQIGALDPFGRISQLGRDLLSISLEPSLGRMIIEGIKRGVTEEMIVIASIFSVNSFLSKDEKWREIQNGTNKKSDIFMYLDLYDLVTKTRISRDILQRLVYPLGLDAEQVREFEKEGNTKSFFEIVDLSPIGIKNHRIAQIYNKVTQLQKTLGERGIHIDKKKALSGKQIFQRAGESKNQNIVYDIITSIASGYPYYIFEYFPEDKKLRQVNKGGTNSPDMYRKAAISCVELQTGKLYHGVPFIIGSEDISEDMGLDTQDHYFSQGQTKEDLNIVSHITLIEEGNLKDAIGTQHNYVSIFPEKKKNITPVTLEEYKNLYYALCEDFSNGILSREDFLTNGVPLLLILQHNTFLKFLNGKSSEVIKSLQQRLKKFFEFNKGDYIHRISIKIDDIEKSFSGDSEIEPTFRDWEQKNITTQKKERKKHIPSEDAAVILLEEERHKYTLQIEEEIGLLRGLVNGLDEQKLKRKIMRLQSDFLQDIKSSGETYNRLFSVYQNEISSLGDKERKDALRNLNQVENSGTKLKALKTRIRQLKNTIEDITGALNYSQKPSKEHFDAIEFESIQNNFNLPKNVNTLTESQKKKFYDGIKSIRDHFNDTTGHARFANALGRARNSFTSILRDLAEKQTHAEQDLASKKDLIEKEKSDTFKTRKELDIFFSKYYDSGYFETTISGKIPKILTELFEKKDLDAVIERWVLEELDYTKMKKQERTEYIFDIIAKLKLFESKTKDIFSKTDNYNKNPRLSIDELTTLLEEIRSTRKTLGDIKSQIFS